MKSAKKKLEKNGCPDLSPDLSDRNWQTGGRLGA
jgi:hypothetical protein